MKTLLSLFVGLFMMLSINAQVGVNKSNPEQALDVNGKVKITDDASAPTAGTMRYNEAGNAFEGYNGTEWESFTAQQTGALPSNPIPIRAFSSGIFAGGQTDITFSSWDGTTYTSPPTGKFLIVTGIYPRPNASSVVRKYYNLGFVSFNGTTQISPSILDITGYNSEVGFINGDQAPLFVLYPGHTLRVFNASNSELIMNVSIRGFLVDNLNY